MNAIGQERWKDRLLASNSTPPELVLNALRNSSQNGARVLDVGAGDGRLVAHVETILPAAAVFTLDRDIRVMKPSRELLAGVVGEALVLPFEDNSFGLVLLVNSAHEICGVGDRLSSFQRLVDEVKRVLKPGGEVIFYDGIMPESSDKLVELHPLTSEARETFRKFSDSYEGRVVLNHSSDKNTLQLSIAEIACFLTKFPYINGPYWDSERKQLYPFLAETQITPVLTNTGLTVKSIDHPVKRNGLIKFLTSYTIDGYDLDNFPAVQVAIMATRN